ncbi:MAG: glucohydrolase, partial [Cetobacterium sp.]
KESVFNFYKKMIKLRQNSEYSEKLIYGKFERIETEEDLIAYKRGENIVSITNLGSSKSEVEITVKDILLNNYETLEVKGERIVLEPYQTILVTKGE